MNASSILLFFSKTFSPIITYYANGLTRLIKNNNNSRRDTLSSDVYARGEIASPLSTINYNYYYYNIN